MNDKVTIYTLADELNVSPSAVSRAFNPNSRLSKEKRQRILAAAEAQGFTPNRAAARLSRRAFSIVPCMTVLWMPLKNYQVKK